MLSGIALTAPAFFLAGLAASPHCGLMCAAVARIATGQAGEGHHAHQALMVNLGRVFAYIVFGALAGAAGGWLMLSLPSDDWGNGLRLMAAAAVIAVGLMHLRRRPPPCMQRAHRPAQLFGRGMAWALIPCPMLYAVLALCALSGGMVSGAVLAGAFGIGTLPAMTALAFGGQRLTAGAARATGATVMLLFGGLTVLGVLLPNVVTLPWCR